MFMIIQRFDVVFQHNLEERMKKKQYIINVTLHCKLLIYMRMLLLVNHGSV